MFRQFGGLNLDPANFYANDPNFRKFVSSQGYDQATFGALPKSSNTGPSQMGLQLQYAKARRASEGSDATQSGVDVQGVRLPGVLGSTSAQADPTVSQALLACKSANQCQKYDSDDIRYELERRGFTNGGSSKYEFRPLSELPAGEAARRTKYDANGNLDENGQYYKKEADFYNRTTKPELIRILLGHNKRLAKETKIRGKLESSLKSARGAFPSESSNPHMYDPKTGLLKEKYLTIDHHGLTAYDIKGDRYRVEWTPFGPNGGGLAAWKKDEEQAPYGTQQLRGVYELDSRGLPKLSQLSYVDDLFKVHQDKKGKLWQVHAARKNRKSKSMAISNVKKNSDGTPKLVWGKYDPTLNVHEKVESTKKKFVTPLGVYTYDQLMKMPLDNILKMMIVLELADESPKYAKKMMDLGVGPFDPSAAAASSMTRGRLTGRQAVPMVKGKEKERSTLKADDKMLQEKKYKQSGFPECEYPQPPHRCYTDSYIPGTCVPDEKMCFNPKLRDPYKAYVNRKGYRADWAIDASEGKNHQYVTEDDIRAIYETAAAPRTAGPSNTGPAGLAEAAAAAARGY